MNILAIETSCDETAISIVASEGGVTPTFTILGNTVASQADLHAQYGGVFPMMAKREHQKNAVPVLVETLKKAGMYNLIPDPSPSAIEKGETTNLVLEEILAREPELLTICKEYLPHIARPNVDVIAVTSGPGLEPALWVGINFAKALGTSWNIPVVPINHMEGHIMSPILTASGTQTIAFPALALLISGGHTELVLVKNWMDYEKIGQTRDDAVGEAFDKVARMLSLPYPGGPHISRLAEEWRNEVSPAPAKGRAGEGFASEKTPSASGISPLAGGENFKLPRPMLHSGDYDFSFSGLKTAVLYALQDLEEKSIPLSDDIKKQIACEFENAATDVLLYKTFKAVDQYGVQTLLVGGGVAANKHIKKSFLDKKEVDFSALSILFPEKDLSTDNALMIAIAGYFHYQNILDGNEKAPVSFKAEGNLGF